MHAPPIAIVVIALVLITTGVIYDRSIPRQNILVTTVPQGATCEISHIDNFQNYILRKTPAVKKIRRPSEDGQPLSIVCTKKGFQPASQTVKQDQNQENMFPYEVEIRLSPLPTHPQNQENP